MSEQKINLSDAEAVPVSGGSALWERNARGSFTIAGNHIVYTAAEGDALSAVAARFGVTVGQLRSWNSSAPDNLSAGERLVIYANTIR